MQKQIMLALFGLSLGACGSDGGDDTTDCLGAGHGGTKPTCGPWADDVAEGGEFRIEIQRNGTDDTTTAATHAYFFKDQIPARRELEGTVIVPGTGCTDVTAGVYFDNGSPAAAIEIANSRTYLDVGETVSISSAEQSFTLQKQLNMMDLSSYLTHKEVYLTPSADGSANLRNHTYDVAWTGGDLGDMELAEPTAVQGYAAAAQLFVPANMTNLDPSFAAPLQIPATGDWTLTYDQEAAPADAPPLLQFIVFYDLDVGGVTHQCVNDGSGTMTVPREMIDKLNPSGLVYFGSFSHIGNLQQGRRLDLVGVNCQYQEFAK